tara:strand:- start:6801 stop:7607 length:807 start_codon:yes stop_codon:yes gene_type:complete
MEYIIGNEYKITGGKYKKHGKGILTRFNKTYSALKVEIGGGVPASHAITGDIKVKNCYLHPVNEGVIEMPEADELQEVQGNPDDFVVMEELAPDEQELVEEAEIQEDYWKSSGYSSFEEAIVADYGESSEQAKKYGFGVFKEEEEDGKLINGIMMYEMKTDTTSGLAPNLDIVIDEVKDEQFFSAINPIDKIQEANKPKCQYSGEDGKCDCDVVMLRKKAEHFEQEFHCALAERDQADDKMNEQDQEIHNLTKRNEYLEEIVRKLLLP